MKYLTRGTKQLISANCRIALSWNIWQGAINSSYLPTQLSQCTTVVRCQVLDQRSRRVKLLSPIKLGVHSPASSWKTTEPNILSQQFLAV